MPVFDPSILGDLWKWLCFLNLGTIDILGWIILCSGVCLVYCRMLSSISGLCPLDGRSTLLLTVQWPLRCKIAHDWGPLVQRTLQLYTGGYYCLSSKWGTAKVPPYFGVWVDDKKGELGKWNKDISESGSCIKAFWATGSCQKPKQPNTCSFMHLASVCWIPNLC